MNRIYMDYNATSIMKESVKNAMMDVLSMPCNPSSIHSFGRDGRGLVEKARTNVLSLLSAESGYNLTFVSSGTEANNLIINNFKDSKILVSRTEHVSILEHRKFMDNIDLLAVDSNGIIKFDLLEQWLSNNPASLVSISLANNETGVIQKISDIAKLVHEYGSFIHSDIVQAPSKIKVDLAELDVDFATVSSHKFGGPVGAAALIHKSEYNIKPQIIGGGQERGVRSGTQNVAAIVGFGVAALEAMDLSENIRILELRNLLEEELRRIDNKIIIFGQEADRLPNTSMIASSNMDAKERVILLDMNGIAISNGSACSSGKVKSSHVLSAMGFSEEKFGGAIRVSLGRENSREDIYQFLNIWRKSYECNH